MCTCRVPCNTSIYSSVCTRSLFAASPVASRLYQAGSPWPLTSIYCSVCTRNLFGEPYRPASQPQAFHHQLGNQLMHTFEHMAQPLLTQPIENALLTEHTEKMLLALATEKKEFIPKMEEKPFTQNNAAIEFIAKAAK